MSGICECGDIGVSDYDGLLDGPVNTNPNSSEEVFPKTIQRSVSDVDLIKWSQVRNASREVNFPSAEKAEAVFSALFAPSFPAGSILATREINISGGATKESDGSSRAQANVGIIVEAPKGATFSGNIGAGTRTNERGKTTTEASVDARVRIPFTN